VTFELPREKVSEQRAAREQFEAWAVSVGWNASEILHEPTVSMERGNLVADYILAHLWNPLACIDVLSGPQFDPENNVSVAEFARAAGVPFAFVTDGFRVAEISTASGSPVFLGSLPTPAELLGRVAADPTDPRWHEPNLSVGISRLHHMQAVSQTIKSVVSGERRALVAMPTGTGISMVQLQLAWKLLGSGAFKRLLLVFDNRQLLEQLALRFREVFDHVETWTGASASRRDPEHARLLFTTTQLLARARQDDAAEDYFRSQFDLVFLCGTSGVTWGTENLLQQFESAVVIGFSSLGSTRSKLLSMFGDPAFEYSLADAVSAEHLVVPAGYVGMRLGDLAELRAGIWLSPDVNSNHDALNVLYVSSRDIGTQVDWSRVAIRQIGDEARVSRYALQLGDILISAVGLTPKVGWVDPLPPSNAVHSQSLIRIRAKSPEIAKNVYAFLISDTGKSALMRLIGGTTIPRISSRDLMHLSVFIPTTPERSTPTQEHQGLDQPNRSLSAASIAVRQIETDILPLLQDAERADVGDPGPDLTLVAEKLRLLAETITPPRLSELVLRRYPMPIAFPYRRFQDARFNVYERVLRLRDVAEAVTYFLYNVSLVDMLRNLDLTLYRVTDKGARRAFNGYGIAQRLDFLEIVFTTSSMNQGSDLFIPELSACDVVPLIREIHEDLRNRISHTAAATESRQSAILREFEPKLDAVLDGLRFLAEYRLVRIPEFYYQQGQLVRRMEIYNGIVPELAQEPCSGLSETTRAERDHLVLLNSEESVMDVHPVYQLVSSEKTGYESHLSVFKQRKEKFGRLEGESVSGAFPIELDGFLDLEGLLSKIDDPA
jgi:hypothetical protein